MQNITNGVFWMIYGKISHVLAGNSRNVGRENTLFENLSYVQGVGIDPTRYSVILSNSEQNYDFFYGKKNKKSKTIYQQPCSKGYSQQHSW